MWGIPLIHLCFNSVGLANNLSHFKVKLKSSKTDPFLKGITLTIHKVGNNICPVSSMFTNPLWWTQATRQPEAPLFVSLERKALSRTFFIKQLKILLAAAGYNPESYNGHSFRIGAATSAAAAAAIPDDMIKTLGRWSSQRYVHLIQTSEESIAGAPRSLSAARQMQH